MFVLTQTHMAIRQPAVKTPVRTVLPLSTVHCVNEAILDKTQRAQFIFKYTLTFGTLSSYTSCCIVEKHPNQTMEKKNQYA